MKKLLVPFCAMVMAFACVAADQAQPATKLPAAIEYDGVEVFPKGKTFVLPLPVTIPDNGKVEDVFANLYELVRDPVIRRMISNIKLFR